MNVLANDLAAALDPVAFAAGLGFVAEPWQERLLRSDARRVAVCCARQVGKTQVTSIKSLRAAVYRPGSLVLIVSPSQAQSDEMLRRIKTLYQALGRPVKAERENASELMLENGSRVVSLPGTETSTRGYTDAKLLVIDEAARVDDDIFASVLPMVGSDGAVWALSTPWGRRGWFFERYSDPAAGWEKHLVSCYESEQYGEARIAEMRSSVGSFTFASDYECVFGDTTTQFFPTELVRSAFDPSIEPMEF